MCVCVCVCAHICIARVEGVVFFMFCVLSFHFPIFVGDKSVR